MDMSPFQSASPITLIIPVYNEEAVLPQLFARLDALVPRLGAATEIIMVDDGSHDNCARLICDKARMDARYRYVALSRNFGHQTAITAGIHLATGSAVIVMDADLQDPPEVALELVEKWRSGFDVVHARRRSRAGETSFKKATATLFYRALQSISDVRMPADVGDFRLLDRRVVDTFKAMPEQDRYVRGMVCWLGFRQAIVDFDRDERAAGATKYSLVRMMRLAFSGIVGFSEAPLRLALWIGTGVSTAALIYAGIIVFRALSGAHLVSGWASLAVLTSLLSGVNMLLLGVIGLYVGQVHREAKRRPLYVVARDTGSEAAPERVQCSVGPAVQVLPL